MENNFENHILEWKEMNMKGRFVEARQFYFEKLFPEVIDNFVDKTIWPLEKVDVLFSVLGYTPEPIILAHKALNPRRHIIFHDKSVTHNEDNVRYLPQFLDDGFLKIEFADETFYSIYEALKEQMALNPGKNYTINVTGGKKSMVASAAIFGRDYSASIIYIDYDIYDPNLRRPLPGTEKMNIVYSPYLNLPELFH